MSAQDALQQQLLESQDHIAQLTAQVQGLLDAQHAQAAAPAPAPVPAPTPAFMPKPPKVTPPSPFNGDWEKLDYFLAQCNLYLSL